MAGPSYSIRKILQSTDLDIDKMTAVLEAAFGIDDQISLGFGPQEAQKLNGPMNRAQVVAASIAGVIYVAEDTSGEIIGVCLWFPPGRMMYDSVDQRNTALPPLMALIAADKQAWLSELTPKLEKFKESVLGEGTATSQWYLQRIGVAPNYQNRGVGTALIKEVLNHSDGFSVVLTTILQKNAEYYERLGFQMKGRREYDAPYGKFEMYVMLWERVKGDVLTE